MKNVISAGKGLPLTAPSGGVVAGQPYLIGSLLVIASASAAEAATFIGVAKGVYEGAKPYNEAWTEGLAIYFDESEGVFTSDDDSAANPLVGVAVAAVPLSLAIASDADPDTELGIVAGLAVIVIDYSALADATITLTINGTREVVLTEGVDFDAETSNAVTAANIAAAINALEGLSSSPTLALATNGGAALTIAANVLTVVDYSSLAGKTITVTINGVATVLTEGAGEDFVAETSNAVTAGNIATAIDALAGVDAADDGADVTVELTATPILVTSPSTTGQIRLDGVAR